MKKWVKRWENKFLKCNQSILHSKFWFEVKIFPWEVVRSILVENLVFMLSHTSSPFILQRKMEQMTLKGSKFGVNIHAWRQRVAQESLKNWFGTLEFILGPLPSLPLMTKFGTCTGRPVTSDYHIILRWNI